MSVLRLLSSRIFLGTVTFEWKSVKLKQMGTGTTRLSSGCSIYLLSSRCCLLVAESKMIAGRCAHSHGIDRDGQKKALWAYPNNPFSLMRSFHSPGIVYISLYPSLFCTFSVSSYLLNPLFDNNYNYDNTPRN